MTRAEAVKLLDLNREYLRNTNNIGLKDDIEALDMAIQALSQEPKSPCDLCRYDYMDDYCGECPAMAKGEWE